MLVWEESASWRIDLPDGHIYSLQVSKDKGLGNDLRFFIARGETSLSLFSFSPKPLFTLDEYLCEIWDGVCM